MGILIEHQAGERDDPLLGFAFGAVVLGGAAQLCLDPRDHFERAERLGDVVIRPQGQAEDLVCLLYTSKGSAPETALRNPGISETRRKK